MAEPITPHPSTDFCGHSFILGVQSCSFAQTLLRLSWSSSEEEELPLILSFSFLLSQPSTFPLHPPTWDYSLVDLQKGKRSLQQIPPDSQMAAQGACGASANVLLCWQPKAISLCQALQSKPFPLSSALDGR